MHTIMIGFLDLCSALIEDRYALLNADMTSILDLFEMHDQVDRNAPLPTGEPIDKLAKEEEEEEEEEEQ